jgi:hypothetical protein
MLGSVFFDVDIFASTNKVHLCNIKVFQSALFIFAGDFSTTLIRENSLIDPNSTEAKILRDAILKKYEVNKETQHEKTSSILSEQVKNAVLAAFFKHKKIIADNQSRFEPEFRHF